MKVKNLVTPVLGLIIGLLIGYFLIPKKQDSNVSFTESNVSFTTSTIKAGILWGPIQDRATAETWINNYRDESNNLWHPLRTESGDILKGFWVDRRMIDTVLAQDRTANGIRIYFAQKRPQETRKYNLVFVGTKPAPITTPRRDPNGNDDFGTYYDYVDPCPTNCGSSGN